MSRKCFSPYPLDSKQPAAIGLPTVEAILEFTWLEGSGAATGVMFWSAITDPAISHVNGEIGNWEFG